MLLLTKRPRRNRKSAAIRNLVQETRLHPNQLVAPLFVIEGQFEREPIESMPHIFRLSLDQLIQEVKELYQLGICAIDLFPFVPHEKKDPFGSEALRKGNLMTQAIAEIKDRIPEMCVMVDIALDPYTSHGHDGLLNDIGEVVNDPTLELLAQMSLLAAEAGADIVAPSDMMDGRVGFIRHALDKEGYSDVGIMAYAAKYASSLYAPFRNALCSSPKKGDKKGYQMNVANRKEALRDSLLDEEEGADVLLIKPAITCLDVIYELSQCTHLPIAAYQVSGEYAMIMAAAEKGWLDPMAVLEESLLSIKRAGADFILTYAAKQVALSMM